jgi:hypothetical protein
MKRTWLSVLLPALKGTVMVTVPVN